LSTTSAASAFFDFLATSIISRLSSAATHDMYLCTLVYNNAATADGITAPCTNAKVVQCHGSAN
jgi:hypothetical protein